MKNIAAKWSLTLIGILSLLLAILGIFLPLLPTVPLVLLSAACFAKSSPKFHHWIHNHAYFGKIITQYSSGKGIPIAARNRAILLVWASLSLSTFIVGELWLGIVLCLIGLGVTLYLISITPKKNS